MHTAPLRPVAMGVRRAGRGKKRAYAPLENGTKSQKFLENLKSTAKSSLIYLIPAMTVYLPV